MVNTQMLKVRVEPRLQAGWFDTHGIGEYMRTGTSDAWHTQANTT